MAPGKGKGGNGNGRRQGDKGKRRRKHYDKLHTYIFKVMRAIATVEAKNNPDKATAILKRGITKRAMHSLNAMIMMAFRCILEEACVVARSSNRQTLLGKDVTTAVTLCFPKGGQNEYLGKEMKDNADAAITKFNATLKKKPE
jgi:histone H3/H4